MAPLANDPIMSGTLIQLFRQLEHQNPSSNGIEIFSVPFLATRKAVVLLANHPVMLGTLIQLFRHLKHQNPSIISGDIGRARSVHQFWNVGKERRNGTEYS